MAIYNIDNRLKPMISVFLGEQIKLNPQYVINLLILMNVNHLTTIVKLIVNCSIA